MPEEQQTPTPTTVAHEPMPVAEPPVSHVPSHKPYLSRLNPDEWFQPDEPEDTATGSHPPLLGLLKDRLFSKSLLLSFALAGASVLIIIVGSVSLLHHDKKPEVVFPATPGQAQYDPYNSPVYYDTQNGDVSGGSNNPSAPSSTSTSGSTGGNPSSSTPAPTPTPGPAPSPAPSPTPTPKTYTVNYATNTGFSPTPLTVKAGDTVVFKNTSNKTIDLAGSGYGGFPALQSIAANGSYSFTFSAKGTLNYSATPNKTGQVIVQ
jgi:plastocyanin